MADHGVADRLGDDEARARSAGQLQRGVEAGFRGPEVDDDGAAALTRTFLHHGAKQR